MAYTKITSTAFGKKAIEYAMGGKNSKGHNRADHRNLYVGYVGLKPGTSDEIAEQMDEYWQYASHKNKNQVRRIIISFSPDELDPNDPNAPFVAAEIATEFVTEYYPDRQCLICVQSDGKGGKLHVHCLVNNVSLSDYKGCTDEQVKFHYVAKNFDKVAKKHIDLKMDYEDKWDKNGKAILPDNKISQHERKLRQANDEADASGKIKPNYIWHDDLKNRIKLAASVSESRDDFKKALEEHGVKIVKTGQSKRYGEYYTYELTDTSGFDKIPAKGLKARSYSLGKDYMPDSIDKLLGKTIELSDDAPMSAVITDEEIAESEEYMKNVLDFAIAHGRSYMNANGELDEDELNAIKADYDAFLKAPSDSESAENSTFDADVEPKLKHRKATKAPVSNPVIPDEPKKESYKQTMINQVTAIAEGMDIDLDAIPDDDFDVI